jgi:hypothetical protein
MIKLSPWSALTSLASNEINLMFHHPSISLEI